MKGRAQPVQHFRDISHRGAPAELVDRQTPACPFLENLVCDEPEGTGVCLEGTDAFDCCATEPGVCEERSQGGRCPDGSDPDDCDTGSTGDTDTDTSSGEMMESRR